MTLVDTLNSSSKRREGSKIPNPPSLAGNASRFRTESFGGGQPVMDGIKSERMVSSRLRRWVIADVRDGAGDV